MPDSTTNFQFTIKNLIAVTVGVAFNLWLYRLSPSWALIAAAPLAVIIVTPIVPGVGLLFFLPLISALSWVVCQFIPWWVSPPDLVLAGALGVLSLVSLIAFTVPRTLRHHRRSNSRDGVVLLGLGNSGLGGLLIGFMVAIPLSLYQGVAYWFGWGFDLFAIVAPFGLVPATAFFGIAIGTVLGFVCDIVAGIEMRNRAKQIASDRGISIR